MQHLRKLLKYMKGYGKECLLGPLFKLLEASFELTIPLVVARIVDQGILGNDRGYIVNMSLIMVLLGAIGLICAVVAQYFAARAAVGFAARLRHSVMAHILGLGYTEIDCLGTSTLITRMTSDVNQIQNGVNLTLRLLLRSPFVVFGAMVMAFTIDVQAALIFAVLIPVLCIVVFGIMLISMPAFRAVQGRLDKVTSSTRQNLTGVRVLRAFCKEEEETAEFRENTKALTAAQLHAGRISALLNPITFVLVNLAVILLMHVGAIKVESGILTQGMVIALYNYMTQILVELIKMANLIITMTKAAACGNRIEQILEVKPSQSEGTNWLDSLQGAVSFENVAFRYDGAAEPSIEHISFRVLPGQTVGVIGGTGSGKTTLINLISRLYDCESGTVAVDGLDVTTLNRWDLSGKIGMVPQKSVLFRGTIRENLLWGNPDATDAELMQALETAQAASVVKDRPQGLDAMVEQGGTNFSGGQRQRLAIARTLVRNPKILILDDSTSALDYATDAALRTAIRNRTPAPTTFLVSQRAASVRFADQILVMDDGALVGIGKHEELLKNCPVYQEIYYSQFPEEVNGHG